MHLRKPKGEVSPLSSPAETAPPIVDATRDAMVAAMDAVGVDAAILGKSLYARAFTLEEALEVAR